MNNSGKSMMSVLVCLLALAVRSEKIAECLSSAAWTGDGRDECNGADWYREDPAPEFRAVFVLPKGVTATKAHFACAGFGAFSLNGVYRMNPDGLDTLWSVYDKTVYSMTKTLGMAEGLRPYPATNEIRVVLGNGFYNLPPLRFWGKFCFREELAHGRPCFKLALEGLSDPLEWKWRKTNVLRNSVYLGTEIDATRPEDIEWKPASAVKGPRGKIIEWPQTNPQTGVHEVHRGVAGWLKEASVQVVDFKVNSSGVPEFRFDGEEPGTVIEIVYGERLNGDGSVNVLTQTAGQIKRPGRGGPGAPDIACQRDVYVCRGSDDVFRPPFTWHVFRYAEVRGARKLLKAGDAARYVRSMVPLFDGKTSAGSFRPSNPDLARLHEVCRRTFQANLIGGVQSDCPGRERLGYGGDIVASCEAMCLNYDMREIYLKILRDFADEAEDDGWLTETAPYVGIADFVGMATDDSGNALSADWSKRAGPVSWTVAVPVLIEALSRHYPDIGDRALAFYPVCRRYIRLMDERFPDGIIPTCIGDHEALERAPNDCTATAHWHLFVRLSAGFAGKLGIKDDQERFRMIGKKIAAAFADRFVRNGIVANGTQSAQAIALYLGLVPDGQIRAAEERLLAAIEEKGGAVSTGIFSTRYMLMYLSEHGYRDLAGRMVLRRDFPGWIHMLERGATTLWETWKESDDVYSNCHPMFGSVDEWVIRFGER